MKVNKIFNITSAFKSVDAEKGLNISGMASTADFDRAGDVIVADAWKKGGLVNFTKNPIILFNHNYNTPIGKATKIEATDMGLALEAFISDSAPGGVSGLIKDGVLGAFSVGFRIKDADYIQETGGLLIKDAELFEVSVVSVPCNQDATFSLAKSFDSENEYEEFKKTFTHSVDLAGQSLAKDEGKPSKIASGAPDGGNDPQLEIKMDKKELEALAKKVAEETALKIALDQAKTAAAAKKAAEEAAANKLAAEKQDETVADAVIKGIQSGTEKLMADIEAKLAEKDVNLATAIEGFKKELEEKADEIAAIRSSKRVFSDRTTSKGEVSAWGEEFTHAHLLGVMTGKGMDTDFAKGIMEKAGVDYITNAPLLDQEIANFIEKEVQMYTDVTGLFRDIPVNGRRTVLPIQPDAGEAEWKVNANPAGNLTSVLSGVVDPGANRFEPSEIVLSVFRLVSQTFLDNDVDEQVLIQLMPMIVDSVARAHALATDKAIVQGGAGGSIAGLKGLATASGGATIAPDGLTAAGLFTARKSMGKYGIKPMDVTYIVSMAEYYNLIDDPEFEDVQLVGDKATKVIGSVGSVYGSSVVISDSFEASAAGIHAAYAVNTRNYAIPRLRSIAVEQDYEVGNQRKVIVASQSLGFDRLVGDYANNRSAVSVIYT